MKFAPFFSALFFLLFTVLVAGIQTTLWPQFFSWVPAPLLWLNVVVYLLIERKPFSALSLIYGIGFVVLAFTATTPGLFLMTLFLLFWMLYLVRSRIFWSGSMYFAFMCFIGNFLYQILSLSLSLIVESYGTSFLIFDRLIQIILTPLFSFLMYDLLKRLDRGLGYENQSLNGVEP